MIKMESRGLTLWEPWATFISQGLKQFETRSWSTKFRGHLLVHAAAQSPIKIKEVIALGDHIRAAGGEPPESWRFNYGYIIAITQLTDCLIMVDRLEKWAWKNLRTKKLCILPASMSGICDSKEDLFESYGFVIVDKPINNCIPVPVAQDKLGKWHEAILIDDQSEIERTVGDWAPGRFAWKLGKTQAIEPISYKGTQRLWVPSAEVIEKLEVVNV